MKTLILVLATFIAPFVGSDELPKSTDTEQVVQAVESFAKSADKQDVKQMDTLMHTDFRAIVNRLFGSEEVAIMDKAVYLDLLQQGKIGGDERTVTIQSIHFEGHNALVKATFTGKELIFHTFIQLVQEASGAWKVISDMPTIEKKQ